MSVSRRTPHSQHGDLFERQTFTCRGCGHEIERSADLRGKPHKSSAPVGWLVLIGVNMGKKKDKSKLAKTWKTLKKTMKKAGKKSKKVDREDVPLVSPTPTADLI
jgi:hypothetical protein